MAMVARWVSGSTRSGKTEYLIEFAGETGAEQQQPLLAFAANGDNRIVLASRMMDRLSDSHSNPHHHTRRLCARRSDPVFGRCWYRRLICRRSFRSSYGLKMNKPSPLSFGNLG